jgi:nitrogen regulatory protein PII
VYLIANAAPTGRIGDGKVWARNLQRLMHIRAGELAGDAV